MPEYIPPPAALPPGSIVWAYLRDSGGPNQDRSTRQQRAEIESYCAQHGLALGQIFCDEARSAKSMTGREALEDLLARSARADLRPAGLLVWDFSRLARDMDDAQFIKSSLRKNGLVIHSLNDVIPEGKLGRVVEVLKDLGAQEERERMIRNVKRGLQDTFRQGFSAGTPPRGYKIQWVEVGKTREGKPRHLARWVPDPDLADLVKLAWAMRAEGRSYGAIRKATQGKLYSGKNSFTAFFRNLAYLGIGKQGDQEIPDHHPALIDRETWDAVQLIQAQTQRPTPGPFHPRRTGTQALLSGLAYCAHCGAAMNYSRIGKHRWACYICGTKDRHGKTSCAARRVNALAAEEAILQAVLGQVLTGEFMAAWLQETQALLIDSSALDRQADKLQKDLAQNGREIKRMIQLAKRFEHLDAVIEELGKLQAEQARLRLEEKDLATRRKLAQATLTPEALDLVLQSWAGAFAAAGQPEGREELRGLLRQFVTRIELDYQTAMIQYTYPYQDLVNLQGYSTPKVWGHLFYPCIKALSVTW